MLELNRFLTSANREPETLTEKPDGVLFEGDRLPLAGVSVAEAKALLRDTWNIPYFADAKVNGRPATSGRVLRHGDLLGFCQRFGLKGGDDLAGEQAFAEALLRSEPGLAAIAGEVAALALPPDEQLRIVTLRVFRWSEERFGRVAAEAAAILEDLAHSLSATGGDRDRPPGQGQPHPGARSGSLRRSTPIRIDEAEGVAVIGGVHHSLDRVCLAILSSLVAAGGGWVSAEDMRSERRILRHEGRIDRLIGKMKDEVQALREVIESRPGRGYRLTKRP